MHLNKHVHVCHAPTSQGLRGKFARLWAPQKARVLYPIFILPPLLGIPENTEVA